MANYLVTGAASGIGEAVTLKLAQAGHNVTLMDTNGDGLTSVEARVGEESRALSFTGSVADAAACRAAVQQSVKKFGGLDGLSHNAGIQRYGTIETTPVELWDEVIAVNLTGGFNIAQAAMPSLRKTHGSVVFMGSVQSLASQESVVAYTAAKHGLLGLTRSMAVDFAKDGIGVNLVAPGSVDTPMLRWAVSQSEDPDALNKMLNDMHPLGRVAQSNEIASVVEFLLGSGASFLTGEVVRVDGGLLARIAGSPED